MPASFRLPVSENVPPAAFWIYGVVPVMIVSSDTPAAEPTLIEPVEVFCILTVTSHVVGIIASVKLVCVSCPLIANVPEVPPLLMIVAVVWIIPAATVPWT